MKRLRRQIVSRSYYTDRCAGWNTRPSVIVKLECGHEKRYTGNNEPRPLAMVECRECRVLSA